MNQKKALFFSVLQEEFKQEIFIIRRTCHIFLFSFLLTVQYKRNAKMFDWKLEKSICICILYCIIGLLLSRTMNDE